MKKGTKAWLLDEDVFVEGLAVRNRFYPDSDMCGFGCQKIYREMYNNTIFFNLEKAISLCGNLPVITKGTYADTKD